MEVLHSIAAVRSWRAAQSGTTVGFVPTMGALHEGHASLIRLARAGSSRTVVSIFVNPTQFDNPEDLKKYPQTLEADLDICRREGVDMVFAPSTQEMYPEGFSTFVEPVGPAVQTLCAVARPGHFRGVCSVVCKLFNIVQPTAAWFGEKDLQQVFVVQRMVRDLDFPVRLEVGPTLREADGLAMSSRNARLSAEARQAAASVPRGLELANRAFKAGERNVLRLTETFYDEVLMHPGTEVDYATVVRIPGFTEVEEAQTGDLLATAVFVDGVRLIDHVLLGQPPLPVQIEEP